MAQHITITTQQPAEVPPVLTHYQLLAGEYTNAIDDMAAVLPKLEEAEAAAANLVRSHLNIPDAFCLTALEAVEQLPELEASKKLDPISTRDKLQFIAAFRPVYDKGTAFLNRLGIALMWMKDSVVVDSLQIYRIAKGYASDKRSPQMAAYVAMMKRDLGRTTPTKAEREERKQAQLREAALQLINSGEFQVVQREGGQFQLVRRELGAAKEVKALAA